MISKLMKKRLLDALREDISKGDITSTLIPRKKCVARIFTKQECIVSGVEEAIFLFKSKGIKIVRSVKDGTIIGKNDTILELYGENRKILSVERTALNILSRMSGISTATRNAIKLLPANSKTKIACTRKTALGLNEFDKKAVAIGGGWTHRKNLNEMVLLKDNHLKFIDLKEAVALGKKKFKGKKIEVEVQNEKQLMEAIESKADIIMLDNFSLKNAEKAIRLIRAKKKNAKIELSGGINSRNLKKFGKLNADFISMGELTHSVKAMDFSLEIIE